MKFLPAVVSGTQHRIILNLFRAVETLGPDLEINAYEEYAFLDGLRRTQTPVPYVEGGSGLNVQVVIRGVTRLIYNEAGLPEGGFNQRVELLLQTLEN